MSRLFFSSRLHTIIWMLCWVLFGLINGPLPATPPAGELTFSCAADNDIYHLVVDQWKPFARFDTPAEAIEAAQPGMAVCILAQGYPEQTTAIDPSVYQKAAEKNLRLYVEFPAAVPGLKLESPRHTFYERAVVADDRFAPELPKMRILGLSDCTFTPVEAAGASLVVAKVAGVDTAVYGLTDTPVFPVLFSCDDGKILVCTSKLSNCITGRYSPAKDWAVVWQRIFQQLLPGQEVPLLSWQATVRPSYSVQETLPKDAEREAVRRGTEWLFSSRMLVHPDWADKYGQWAESHRDRVAPAPSRDWPVGDGSLGVLEGFNANIYYDGSQYARWWRRSDCNGEACGMLSIAGRCLDDDRYLKTSRNIGDYWYFKSEASNGIRMDPKNPAYGLIGWNDVGYSQGVYYGDDHARFILGMLAAAAVQETDDWDERMARFLYACIRTTGRRGFRVARIDQPNFPAGGWEPLFRSSPVIYHPHYEAYLWATMLWAYEQTGDRIFLDRTKTAIQMTMQAYPQWSWTNGIQQERTRMLLPLAWLVRVEDTPENRELLDRMVREVLSYQEPCGGIREQFGEEGGAYGPPKSNAAYGTTEASLLQTNDDRICDMLYTTNFAFLGLHEAAAATGNPEYKKAADRMADFLCRIQVRSESHPELDGAWFRAFDINRWEYWASNADAGWGAWSIEVGWTQAWIVSVLAMRQMDTSLWELSQDADFKEAAAAVREEMIPKEVIESLQPQTIQHTAVGKPVVRMTPADPHYLGAGTATIVDGELSPADHASGTWLGYQGSDFVAIIDLEKPSTITQLGADFLQSVRVGVFLPTQVNWEVSDDGQTFRPATVVKSTLSPKEEGPLTKTLWTEQLDGVRARYVRVSAHSIGRIPEWHHSGGRPAWLFVDEIFVKTGP